MTPMTDEYAPGMMIRFVLEDDRITNSHLPTLVTGIISGGYLAPCQHRRMIPVDVVDYTGRTWTVWTSDDLVLSTSHHPSGGLP